MPIVLNTNPGKERRLEIGDSVIVYTMATGDEVQRALEKTCDPQSGRYDHPSAAAELMRSHVCGWENVIDAEGQPVPYSEDLVEMFVGALGYAERLRLDAAITSSYVEGVEGKDGSPSGSNGTG